MGPIILLELWLFWTFLTTRRWGGKLKLKGMTTQARDKNETRTSCTTSCRRCKLPHAGTEKSKTDNGVPAWSPVDMQPSITVLAGVCLIAGMLWRAGSSSAVNLSFSSSAFAWHVWTHASCFCAIRELNCSSPISHTYKMVGLFSFCSVWKYSRYLKKAFNLSFKILLWFNS